MEFREWDDCSPPPETGLLRLSGPSVPKPSDKPLLAEAIKLVCQEWLLVSSPGETLSGTISPVRDSGKEIMHAGPKLSIGSLWVSTYSLSTSQASLVSPPEGGSAGLGSQPSWSHSAR